VIVVVFLFVSFHTLLHCIHYNWTLTMDSSVSTCAYAVVHTLKQNLHHVDLTDLTLYIGLFMVSFVSLGVPHKHMLYDNNHLHVIYIAI